MRIGIFGGSFDPVHTQHVSLAEAAIQNLRLDRLFVMPAAAPPHKIGKTLTADETRLRMCEIAFAPLEKVEISDYEIAQGGLSYTYLTCRHFRTLYPDAEIFWLVGTDMLRDFPTWKHPESILNDVTLAVCARAEKEGWIERERAAFSRRFGKEFAVVGYNGADVSSTRIRVLAGAGENVEAFVGKEVAVYIAENGLYEIAGAKAALALENPKRKAHSLRVAETAAKKAVEMRLSERKAIAAGLFHDCAKNLESTSPLLDGFSLKTEWGEVPEPVLHQFAGAYVAQTAFHVEDADVVNAIRFHTSGRAEMSELEKLVFLADMVEEERIYEGVENLRALFWAKKGTGALDECLERALEETVIYLKKKGADVYPLTLKAYEWIKKQQKSEV